MAHNFKADDIVFLKDHRPPAAGVNPKFRPTLLPSPYVIVEVKSHLIEVVRLVDRFFTRVNPDDVVKVPLGQPPEYEGLNSEVLKELGRGISENALKLVAKLDTLPVPDHENPEEELDESQLAKQATSGLPAVPDRLEDELLPEASDDEGENKDARPEAAEDQRTVQFQEPNWQDVRDSILDPGKESVN